MASAHTAASGALRPSRLAHRRDLVLHLARRELSSLHRSSLLGIAWPLLRIVAQTAVLAFIFSSVLDLGIEDYPVFVFSGLIAWSWFASGLTNGTTSVLGQRHLVLQPRFPVAVLPAVSVTVALADVLVALALLLVVLAVTGELAWTALFLPLLIAVQLVLMCGLAWIAAAASVYLRDVRSLVTVGLLLLFYLTPIFYDVDRVPEQYRSLLSINPMTTILEGYRATLIDAAAPDFAALGLVALASAALAVLGLLVFRRLEGGFVDEL